MAAVERKKKGGAKAVDEEEKILHLKSGGGGERGGVKIVETRSTCANENTKEKSKASREGGNWGIPKSSGKTGVGEWEEN